MILDVAKTLSPMPVTVYVVPLFVIVSGTTRGVGTLTSLYETNVASFVCSLYSNVKLLTSVSILITSTTKLLVPLTKVTWYVPLSPRTNSPLNLTELTK